MKVLKEILKERKDHYKKAKLELEREMAKLPKGSIKRRKIGGGIYYYLQYRNNEKVIHKYLGKSNPNEIISKIKKRKALQNELKKAKEALNLISKTK